MLDFSSFGQSRNMIANLIMKAKKDKLRTNVQMNREDIAGNLAKQGMMEKGDTLRTNLNIAAQESLQKLQNKGDLDVQALRNKGSAQVANIEQVGANSRNDAEINYSRWRSNQDDLAAMTAAHNAGLYNNVNINLDDPAAVEQWYKAYIEQQKTKDQPASYGFDEMYGRL